MSPARAFRAVMLQMRDVENRKKNTKAFKEQWRAFEPFTPFARDINDSTIRKERQKIYKILQIVETTFNERDRDLLPDSDLVEAGTIEFKNKLSAWASLEGEKEKPDQNKLLVFKVMQDLLQREGDWKEVMDSFEGTLERLVQSDTPGTINTLEWLSQIILESPMMRERLGEQALTTAKWKEGWQIERMFNVLEDWYYNVIDREIVKTGPMEHEVRPLGKYKFTGKRLESTKPIRPPKIAKELQAKQQEVRQKFAQLKNLVGFKDETLTLEIIALNKDIIELSKIITSTPLMQMALDKVNKSIELIDNANAKNGGLERDAVEPTKVVIERFLKWWDSTLVKGYFRHRAWVEPILKNVLQDLDVLLAKKKTLANKETVLKYINAQTRETVPTKNRGLKTVFKSEYNHFKLLTALQSFLRESTLEEAKAFVKRQLKNPNALEDILIEASLRALHVSGQIASRVAAKTNIVHHVVEYRPGFYNFNDVGDTLYTPAKFTRKREAELVLEALKFDIPDGTEAFVMTLGKGSYKIITRQARASFKSLNYEPVSYGEAEISTGQDLLLAATEASPEYAINLKLEAQAKEIDNPTQLIKVANRGGWLRRADSYLQGKRTATILSNQLDSTYINAINAIAKALKLTHSEVLTHIQTVLKSTLFAVEGEIRQMDEAYLRNDFKAATLIRNKLTQKIAENLRAYQIEGASNVEQIQFRNGVDYIIADFFNSNVAPPISEGMASGAISAYERPIKPKVYEASKTTSTEVNVYPPSIRKPLISTQERIHRPSFPENPQPALVIEDLTARGKLKAEFTVEVDLSQIKSLVTEKTLDNVVASQKRPDSLKLVARSQPPASLWSTWQEMIKSVLPPSVVKSYGQNLVFVTRNDIERLTWLDQQRVWLAFNEIADKRQKPVFVPWGFNQERNVISFGSANEADAALIAHKAKAKPTREGLTKLIADLKQAKGERTQAELDQLAQYEAQLQKINTKQTRNPAFYKAYLKIKTIADQRTRRELTQILDSFKQKAGERTPEELARIAEYEKQLKKLNDSPEDEANDKIIAARGSLANYSETDLAKIKTFEDYLAEKLTEEERQKIIEDTTQKEWEAKVDEYLTAQQQADKTGQEPETSEVFEGTTLSAQELQDAQAFDDSEAVINATVFQRLQFLMESAAIEEAFYRKSGAEILSTDPVITDKGLILERLGLDPIRDQAVMVRVEQMLKLGYQPLYIKYKVNRPGPEPGSIISEDFYAIRGFLRLPKFDGWKAQILNRDVNAKAGAPETPFEIKDYRRGLSDEELNIYAGIQRAHRNQVERARLNPTIDPSELPYNETAYLQGLEKEAKLAIESAPQSEKAETQKIYTDYLNGVKEALARRKEEIAAFQRQQLQERQPATQAELDQIIATIKEQFPPQQESIEVPQPEQGTPNWSFIEQQGSKLKPEDPNYSAWLNDFMRVKLENQTDPTRGLEPGYNLAQLSPRAKLNFDPSSPIEMTGPELSLASYIDMQRVEQAGRNYMRQLHAVKTTKFESDEARIDFLNRMKSKAAAKQLEGANVETQAQGIVNTPWSMLGRKGGLGDRHLDLLAEGMSTADRVMDVFTGSTFLSRLVRKLGFKGRVATNEINLQRYEALRELRQNSIQTIDQVKLIIEKLKIARNPTESLQALGQQNNAAATFVLSYLNANRELKVKPDGSISLRREKLKTLDSLPKTLTALANELDTVHNMDGWIFLAEAKKGDFVILDPAYITEARVRYNHGHADQTLEGALSRIELIREAANRGAKILYYNAPNAELRAAFEMMGFNVEEIKGHMVAYNYPVAKDATGITTLTEMLRASSGDEQFSSENAATLYSLYGKPIQYQDLTKTLIGLPNIPAKTKSSLNEAVATMREDSELLAHVRRAIGNKEMPAETALQALTERVLHSLLKGGKLWKGEVWQMPTEIQLGLLNQLKDAKYALLGLSRYEQLTSKGEVYSKLVDAVGRGIRHIEGLNKRAIENFSPLLDTKGALEKMQTANGIFGEIGQLVKDTIAHNFISPVHLALHTGNGDAIMFAQQLVRELGDIHETPTMHALFMHADENTRTISKNRAALRVKGNSVLNTTFSKLAQLMQVEAKTLFELKAENNPQYLEIVRNLNESQLADMFELSARAMKFREYMVGKQFEVSKSRLAYDLARSYMQEGLHNQLQTAVRAAKAQIETWAQERLAIPAEQRAENTQTRDGRFIAHLDQIIKYYEFGKKTLFYIHEGRMKQYHVHYTIINRQGHPETALRDFATEPEALQFAQEVRRSSNMRLVGGGPVNTWLHRSGQVQTRIESVETVLKSTFDRQMTLLEHQRQAGDISQQTFYARRQQLEDIRDELSENAMARRHGALGALDRRGNPQSFKRDFAHGREHLDMLDQIAIHAQRISQKWAKQLTDSMTDLTELSPFFQSEKGEKLRDTLVTAINNLRSKDDPIGTFISKLNFVMFMGLNASVATVESMSWSYVMPSYLMEQGIGTGQAWSLSSKAWKEVSNHAISGKWSNPRYKELIERTEVRGSIAQQKFIDFSQSAIDNEVKLLRVANGEEAEQPQSVIGSLAHGSVKVASKFYQIANRYNADISVIAAYEGLKLKYEQAGFRDAEARAFEEADFHAGAANGALGRAGRPAGLFKNKLVGQVAYSLQSFAVGHLCNMVRYIKNSKESPGARRAMLNALACNLAISGAIGMPFVGPMMAAFKNMTDIDPEAELSKFFNTDANDFDLIRAIGTNGIIQELGFPVDVQSRIAVHGAYGFNPVTGWEASSVFGPMGSWGKKVAMAVNKFEQDRPISAAAELLPVGFKRALQLIEDDGDFVSNNGDLRMPLTEMEQLGSVVGFTPVAVAKTQKMMSAAQTAVRRREGKEREIINEIARQSKNGDFATAIQIAANYARENKQFDWDTLINRLPSAYAKQQFGSDPRMIGTKRDAEEVQQLSRVYDMKRVPETWADRRIVEARAKAMLSGQTKIAAREIQVTQLAQMLSQQYGLAPRAALDQARTMLGLHN